MWISKSVGLIRGWRLFEAWRLLEEIWYQIFFSREEDVHVHSSSIYWRSVKWKKTINEMSGNMPGRNFLGRNFPGGIFLEPSLTQKSLFFGHVCQNFSLRMLLSFCLNFLRFQPNVAYKKACIWMPMLVCLERFESKV